MIWMMIGILLFALVGGSLTTDIIDLTTDYTIYSLDDVRVVSKIAGLGDSYFGVQQLLALKTPATHFTACTAGDCIKALQNKSVDAVVGPYAALVHAKVQLDSQHRHATNPTNPTEAAATATTGTTAEAVYTTGDRISDVYITGDNFQSDLMYSYYLVYRPSHFDNHSPHSRSDFRSKMKRAADQVRAKIGTAEAVNFPISERVKRPGAAASQGPGSILPIGVATGIFVVFYTMLQCMYARSVKTAEGHKQKSGKAAGGVLGSAGANRMARGRGSFRQTLKADLRNVRHQEHEREPHCEKSSSNEAGMVFVVGSGTVVNTGSEVGSGSGGGGDVSSAGGGNTTPDALGMASNSPAMAMRQAMKMTQRRKENFDVEIAV